MIFLTSGSRYLYEISDYDVCLRIIETASSATEDQNSLQMAHLCNTAASCYYELNRIGDCRKNWEIALNIREILLDDDDIEVQNDLHHLTINLLNLSHSVPPHTTIWEIWNQLLKI